MELVLDSDEIDPRPAAAGAPNPAAAASASRPAAPVWFRPFRHEHFPSLTRSDSPLEMMGDRRDERVCRYQTEAEVREALGVEAPALRCGGLVVVDDGLHVGRGILNAVGGLSRSGSPSFVSAGGSAEVSSLFLDSVRGSKLG